MENTEGNNLQDSVANKPSILIETRRGRSIDSTDLLLYTDKRSVESFVQILKEGILSPGIARMRSGGALLNEKGSNVATQAGYTEPNAIFTSLYGVYWSSSCGVVFNAWDTLSKFRFYDQGNSGLKLYDQESDENPAVLPLGEEFLILVPYDKTESKMNDLYLKDLTGNEREEKIKWLEKHVITVGEIKEAVLKESILILNENPDYKAAIIKELNWLIDNNDVEERYKQIASKILENSEDSDLAEYFCFGFYPTVFAWENNGTKSATFFFQNEKSSDLTERKYHWSDEREESRTLSTYEDKLRTRMQKWLKEEFQRKFGNKSGRKATLKKQGPVGNDRSLLIVQKD